MRDRHTTVTCGNNFWLINRSWRWWGKLCLVYLDGTLYRVADTEMPNSTDKPEVWRLREQLQVWSAIVEEVLFQMAL